MKTFNKDDFVPEQNPYEVSESENSKAQFGCDVVLSPCDLGYELRPVKTLLKNEAMIKGKDFSDIPFWARNLTIITITF